MQAMRIGELRELLRCDADAAARIVLFEATRAVGHLQRRVPTRDPLGELAAEVSERILVLDPAALGRARPDRSIAALAAAIGRHVVADLQRAAKREERVRIAASSPPAAPWRSAFLQAHPVATWSGATTQQAVAVFAIAVAGLRPAEAARLLRTSPAVLRARVERGRRAIARAGAIAPGSPLSARLRKALLRLANSREELGPLGPSRTFSIGGRAPRYD